MATKARLLTAVEVDKVLGATRIDAPHYHWERTGEGYAASTITASAQCEAEWADVGHHRRIKVEICGREGDMREVRVWFFGSDGTTIEQHASPWCDGSF